MAPSGVRWECGMNKMLIILSGKEFPMQSSDDTRALVRLRRTTLRTRFGMQIAGSLLMNIGVLEFLPRAVEATHVMS